MTYYFNDFDYEEAVASFVDYDKEELTEEEQAEKDCHHPISMESLGLTSRDFM